MSVRRSVQLYIRDISERISQEVIPQDGQADGNTRKGGNPRGLEHERPSLADRALRVADGVSFFLKIRNEAFHLQYLYNDGPIRKSPSDRGGVRIYRAWRRRDLSWLALFQLQKLLAVPFPEGFGEHRRILWSLSLDIQLCFSYIQLNLK